MEQLYNECVNAVPFQSEEDEGFKKLKKDKSFEARRERGCKKAFTEITSEAEDRIRYYSKLPLNYRRGDQNDSSNEDGRTSARIYQFLKSKNIKFEGIYLLDLLIKGGLTEMLRNHFKPFQCYLRRINDDKYAIFVSWKTETETENTTK
jgi:hypothetical protein